MAAEVDDASTQPSVRDLVRDLAGQTATLVRQEVQLATLEVTGKAKLAAREVAVAAAGAALVYAGTLFVLAAIAALLAQVMPIWVAVILVGLLAFIGGFALARHGLAALRRIDPAPRQAIAAVDSPWPNGPAP